VKWPFHTDQECDYCYSREHEATDCTSPKKEFSQSEVCDNCGHGDDHPTQKCEIKDGSKKNQLDQWTKKNYEARKAKNEADAAAKVAAKKPSTSLPDRSAKQLGKSTSITSPKSRIYQSKSQATSSNSTSQGLVQDPSNRAETERLPVKVDREAKSVSSEAQEKLEWAAAGKSLAVVTHSEEPRRDDRIHTNFLNVTVSDHLDIRKYRIELGSINGKAVTKKELRRASIWTLTHPTCPNCHPLGL